jgi:hypothetical protein
MHAMLSGVFRLAMIRGELATNPCARADVPTARAPTWSLVQTRQFFASDVVRADLPNAADRGRDRTSPW